MREGACEYVSAHACRRIKRHVCMCACTHVCMHRGMFMYACMHVSGCLAVSLSMHVCT